MFFLTILVLFRQEAIGEEFMDHTVCPGSKYMRQPKPELFPCPGCKGEVEIWSDEISGRCTACGTMVMRDGTMSCLEWCAMGRECVGDDVFDSFKERKAESIKERLLKLASDAAEKRDKNFKVIERSLYFAEILSKEEEADLHVVLAGAVLSQIFDKAPDPARKELLRMGYQLNDADEVCRMVADGTGISGDEGINNTVVHDSCLLARQEEISETGYAGDPSSRSETVAGKCLTHTGSELARKVFA
jgi:hypothetical protein